MVFSDALTKAGRLVELQRAFWASPNRPLSTRHLAGRLGCAPRTVRKYLTELSACGRLPITREGHGWRLIEGARLEVPPVRFLLEEAAAVYVAARLLVQQTGKPNPAVRGAVGKLASVVPSDLRLPFERLVEHSSEPGNEHFAAIFRTLAYGWALRRVVRLSYAPRTRDSSFGCAFSPYLLEPSAVGAALYAIGLADPPGETRVFKLERIRAAELTGASFEPPALDLLEQLDATWGVWLSDEQPVEVRLAFDAEVARRLRETRWHPSQHLETGGDGGVIMTVTVASTVEMLPWILGWGSHCEVLAPAELRRQVATDLARAAARYGR